MALCILQGLEPSACDGFRQSTSLACQCLYVAGNGLKMLSAIKRLLLKSNRQFASGSEHFLGKEASSSNKHLLSGWGLSVVEHLTSNRIILDLGFMELTL
jgi:hypothetical protein